MVSGNSRREYFRFSEESKQCLRAWMKNNGDNLPQKLQLPLLKTMVEQLEGGTFDETKIYTFCVNDRIQRRKTTNIIDAEQVDKSAQAETLKLIFAKKLQQPYNSQVFSHLLTFYTSCNDPSPDLIRFWAENLGQSYEIVTEIINYQRLRHRQLQQSRSECSSDTRYQPPQLVVNKTVSAGSSHSQPQDIPLPIVPSPDAFALHNSLDHRPTSAIISSDTRLTDASPQQQLSPEGSQYGTISTIPPFQQPYQHPVDLHRQSLPPPSPIALAAPITIHHPAPKHLLTPHLGLNDEAAPISVPDFLRASDTVSSAIKQEGSQASSVILQQQQQPLPPPPRELQALPTITLFKREVSPTASVSLSVRPHILQADHCASPIKKTTTLLPPPWVSTMTALQNAALQSELVSKEFCSLPEGTQFSNAMLRLQEVSKKAQYWNEANKEGNFGSWGFNPRSE